MAPPALATATSAHRANATNPQRSAHRIPCNDHAAQRSAAQRTAQMQPARRGPRIASRATTTQSFTSPEKEFFYIFMK